MVYLFYFYAIFKEGGALSYNSLSSWRPSIKQIYIHIHIIYTAQYHIQIHIKVIARGRIKYSLTFN